MRTLIVNSYHADADKKIESYVKLVSQHSEYKIEKDVNVHKDYDLSGYDAVILSGSPGLISFGIYPKRYPEFLVDLEIPTLGICYGHQLLAFAFGAEIKSPPTKIASGLPTFFSVIFANKSPPSPLNFILTIGW